MWYVNKEENDNEQKEEVSCILTMSDVNAVVVINIIGLSLAGFILTMWYVNVGDTNLNDNVKISFILTMWYVNIKKKFYLIV